MVVTNGDVNGVTEVINGHQVRFPSSDIMIHVTLKTKISDIDDI